jgi:hypothetical protein
MVTAVQQMSPFGDFSLILLFVLTVRLFPKPAVIVIRVALGILLKDTGFP